jgi:3-phosphoshikimate 1-carboxyvinyltransferase
MKHAILTPIQKPITAEISIPGSIGYTIRALNIAAMTKGSVKIINPLLSDDTRKMIEALQTLGITVEEGKNYFLVTGDINDVKDSTYTIDIGLSGRTARSILAFLCVVPGEKKVICSEPFKKRPVGDLVEGLRQLGAQIEYIEEEGYLPVKILRAKLSEKKIKMTGSNSSQFFSAIMMIAPIIGEITIDVIGKQASKPFIDMTIDIMKRFGTSVENNNYTSYKIKKDQTYKNPKTYIVEPESTSASYFFAIAAITKSTIKVLNLNLHSVQGDLLFVNILQLMGCEIKENVNEHWIEVKGTNTLNGITIDLNGAPDLVPTLAVVAAFAKGVTKMTNIEHARLKETDRIQSPATELEKMGIKTEYTQDCLSVYGGQTKPAEINTYHDHRMAMAFAVAGSKINGLQINDSDVVNKSFPNFWKKLEELGISVKEYV